MRSRMVRSALLQDKGGGSGQRRLGSDQRMHFFQICCGAFSSPSFFRVHRPPIHRSACLRTVAASHALGPRPASTAGKFAELTQSDLAPSSQHAQRAGTEMRFIAVPEHSI